MYTYKYLIVGGGMAGDSAVGGIRSIDSDGSIGMIGAEGSRPYDRPPLSKKLWSGKPLETIWRGNATPGLTYHLGRRVVSIDRDEKVVTDDRDHRYRYERLLLATGGTPRTLPFEVPGIIYFRTLKDYWRLRSEALPGKRVAVIGGGFIGSELAAALVGAGCKVTMVFPETHIGARTFPADLGEYLDDYYHKLGVTVRAQRMLEAAEHREEGYRLTLTASEGHRKRETLKTDIVVAGLGITPNTELAQAAGLTVDNGIVVDERLRTTDTSIFAAGDVASFQSTALDKRMRVEHEDNANTMGAAAGAAMAGKEAPYNHQPSFYSDLFDLGYEAVGELDSRLAVVSDWTEPFRKGVLYYLRDERVVGVLLWNVWDKVPEARTLIASKQAVTSADLIGRISDK